MRYSDIKNAVTPRDQKPPAYWFGMILENTMHSTKWASAIFDDTQYCFQFNQFLNRRHDNGVE